MWRKHFNWGTVQIDELIQIKYLTVTARYTQMIVRD